MADYAQHLFPHRCTITPRTRGTLDAHGQPAMTSGSAVTLQPCKYEGGSREGIRGRGNMIGETFSGQLFLPIDAAIGADSLVSAIVDRDGASLAAGTYQVAGIRKLNASPVAAVHHYTVELKKG